MSGNVIGADIREQLRLKVLARYDILDTPREKDFDDIAELASEICGTPIAVINLIADRRQFFKAEVGLGVRETPFDSSFCAEAILEDDFLVVPDATLDKRFDCNPLVAGEPHLRFYAGAVLKSPDDQAIGTLCVLDFQPRELNATQRKALRVLANQIIAQLELRHALRRKIREVDIERRLGARRLARATASEMTNDRLRSEEERLKTAQSAGGVGTFELNVETDVLTVSEEFCRIFGVPVVDTLPSSEIETLVLPEDGNLRSGQDTRRDGSASLDVDYRIRRADDRALRWISRRARFVRNEQGAVTRMVGVVFDTTDSQMRVARTSALLRLGDELRDASSVPDIAGIAAEIFADSLDVIRAGYATVDRRAEAFNIEANTTARGARSIVGSHALSRFSATFDMLSAGQTVVVEDVLSSDWLAGDITPFSAIGARSVLIVPTLNAGNLVGVLFAHDSKPRTWSQDELDFAWGVADRTYAALAKIQAEAEQTLLNQELSHRLKNSLAMVRAIAGQTLKDVSERDAVEAFMARLQALSTAHDVLVHQNWSTAKIRNVIEKVLALHVEEDRTLISGPDLSLGPKAGLSLSLLLHELSTNAIKYGALSNSEGKVHVEWSIEDLDGDEALSLSWHESGGPNVVEPLQKGFGSRLIRMGLVGTGQVDKRYLPSGLTATFKAPMAFLRETGD